MKQPNITRPLLGGALLLILAVPVMAQPGQRGPRDGRGGDGRGGDGRGGDGRGGDGRGGDGRGGDGRGGDGRGGDGRGPRAKGELNRIWHDIADLEDGQLALTRAQSAQVVALVLPVSRQPALSDDAAKTLADKIEAVLTSAQRTEIDKDHPRGGRGRGGPRDGGPPRMNRDDFEKVRPFVDALNPFYPPTGYSQFKSLPTEFAKDVAKRYGERRALLETLSKRAQGK